MGIRSEVDWPTELHMNHHTLKAAAAIFAVPINKTFLLLKYTGGLQPIPGDPKRQRMAAMLDDKTKGSVIQHGCHTILFWISSSRDWLQTTYMYKNQMFKNPKHLG